VFEVDYVVGLGANHGSRRATNDAALALLASTPGCRVARVSTIYESAPVGPPQPRYLNGAARVYSELTPLALLDRLHAIEAALGRTRGERWGARTLDLDILWSSRAWSDARLSIPHPRLCERWFALAPLLEVAPELAGAYADRVEALLASEAPLAAHVAAPVEVELATASPRGFAAVARASDVPDAFAAALTALGRALAPQPACGKTEAQVLLGRCAPGEELAAMLRAALERLEGGSVLVRAAVCELGEGRFDARLLVCAAPDAAPPRARRVPAKVIVTRTREPSGARVELALTG
jgi:2-amino-4-hydroxy-6-hydroxymethyldihydropteridine diphosphokinase